LILIQGINGSTNRSTGRFGVKPSGRFKKAIRGKTATNSRDANESSDRPLNFRPELSLFFINQGANGIMPPL
jgi:hypothetical protein